jgi:ABC-type multidrug transport system permease subunit
VELKEQLHRSFTLFIRNQVYWIGQTAMALVLALFIAFSAFQLGPKDFSIRARIDVLYFTAVFFQFFPFIPFLFVCYRDKLVLRRERRDSVVRVSPAYLSSWLVIYTFRFFMVTLFTCIVNFIVDLRLPFNYTLVFWLALLMEAWVAMGMGYLIVIFVENMAVAETLASLILLLCIWFSGDFAYNPEYTWILRWISYLSPIFYAFNALVNNEFDGAGGKGEKILRETDLDYYGVWPSIGTLTGLGLFYMIFGYFALSFKTRSTRKYI